MTGHYLREFILMLLCANIQHLIIQRNCAGLRMFILVCNL
jgi:hypothetical protein